MSAQPDNLPQIRMPPHAVSAEQSVLGGLLLVNEALPKVSGWLKPDDFYHRGHAAIYAAMLEFASGAEPQPFDAVTLADWFEARGEAEQIDGGAYLIELASTTPGAANITAYAEIVREKAQMRRLIESGTALVNDGFESRGKRSDEIALEATTALLNLSGGAKPRGPKSMADVATRWFDDLQRRYNHGGGMIGMPTPWGKLNRETLGLCAGDLVIVAGRPSMGKSTMAVNLATSVVLRNKRALFFNLEMTDVSIFNRCVASVMDVPLKWLRSAGHAKEFEGVDYWPRVSVGVSKLKAAPLIIDDTPGLAAQQIVSRAKREQLRAPLGLVIIDHLHLVKLGKGDTHREIQEATGAFKALAKSLGCPVVVLSQLNRGLEARPNKRPQMQDLRESGAIEQDADVILFLYRDDYYAEREGRASEYPGMVEMFIAKQREGEAGQTVWMRDRLAVGLLDDCEDEPVRAAKAERPLPKMRNRGRDLAAGADF